MRPVTVLGLCLGVWLLVAAGADPEQAPPAASTPLSETGATPWPASRELPPEAAPAEEAPPAVSPASLFVPSETALRLAPECDRAVTVRAAGVWYALAVLHHRWRLAVARYRVPVPGGAYTLQVGFDHDGLLAACSAEPMGALPEGLAEACLGLPAADLRPAAKSPSDPQALLYRAARDFIAAEQDQGLARALWREQLRLDAIGGATP